MIKPDIFKYFKTSPQIIRLAVMMYVRYPLSLRNVEDLPHERGIDISLETVRFWWNRLVRCLPLESVGDEWTECVRDTLAMAP